MDLITLWNNLPADAKAVITGMAGELAASMVTAAGYQVKKRFDTPPKREALDRAVGHAVAATALAINDDPIHIDHTLALLNEWLTIPDVIGELSRIIDPQPETALDTGALTIAFEDAGFDPETVGQGLSFAQVITLFADAFCDAAAIEGELEGPIKIALLRELTAQAKSATLTGKRQLVVQERIAAAVEQLAQSGGGISIGDHATNVAVGTQITQTTTTIQQLTVILGQDRFVLSDVEQHHLERLYHECNELPLAEAEVDDIHKPQLQRVYVDLRTQTPPSVALIWQRLADVGVERRALEAALRQRLADVGAELRAVEAALGKVRRESRCLRVDEQMAFGEGGQANPIAMLTPQGLSDLAEALVIDASVLRGALANMSIFELLTSQTQCVLLGHPGSGKSTLTRRLAGVLAALGCEKLLSTLSEDDLIWAQQLHAIYGRRLLPVRVVLSRWARDMRAAKRPRAAGCADDLIEACVQMIGETASLPGQGQKAHFVERLKGESPAVMLLLDGLDEVADVTQRQRVLEAISDFHRAYGDVPMVVTCRVRPYTEGKQYKLPLPDFALAPLDRPASGHFLDRWYAELARVGLYETVAAAQAKRRLLDAMDNPSRHELAEMAGTPLLLTMMARVNYKHGLPDNRAQLYELYVKQLLLEWDRSKQADQGGRESRLDRLLTANKITEASLQRALNKLAFEVHGERDTVEIPAWRIKEALAAIHAGEGGEKDAWAANALAVIDDRSGLIYATEEAKSYVFTHRSFQEYLAARWLASGGTKAMIPHLRDRLDDEQWREVIFLAFGHYISVQEEYDIPLGVIDELLPEAPTNSQEWSRALLLSEAYVRLLGPQRASEAVLTGTAEAVMKTVPLLLTAAMQNPDLPARQRLDAGLLADDLKLDPPGLDDFVPTNGWFTTPGGDRFRIARYPVTNKQYRRFVRDGGYTPESEDRYWSDEGLRIKRLGSWPEPRWWNDGHFNRDSQPVVAVCWHEACAYCVWLTEQLRVAGHISENEEARLPTTTEWQTAVYSTHGKEYPWGSDKLDLERANTLGSNLKQTTPVHMYPDGVTPDGVWGLSGNVWEWTNDWNDHKDIWLKGGSWIWEGIHASASASPNTAPPDGWNHHFGFRVVLVPSSRPVPVSGS